VRCSVEVSTESGVGIGEFAIANVR
jgi:hypothetical protein